MASSPWTTFRARRGPNPQANFGVVLAYIEASAHQALRVVPHFHTGKLERPRHLVAREQTQFDALAAVLDAVRRASQVIVQEKRQLSFLEADAHAVYLVGSDLASEDERPGGAPLLGGEPWLDDQRTAGSYMMHHAGDRTLETLEGPDDTDRAEQTGDDVVGATEIEVHHVGTDIVARGVLQPRSAQIALVDVDAIDRVMVLEEFRVRAGAARNIEDRARAGYKLIDQAAQELSLSPPGLDAENDSADLSVNRSKLLLGALAGAR
jgi:hypothetical protein